MNALRVPMAVVGRILLGLYFLVPGITKIASFSAMLAYMTTHGVPFTAPLLMFTAALQIGGGLVVGLGIAYGIAKAAGAGIANVLFNVSPMDPLIYTVVAAIVVLVSVAATFVPARRATRVDPIVALRTE